MKLKFRAWDKRNEMWLDYIKLSSDGTMMTAGDHQMIPIKAPEDIEIMQYTGLIDKNGKEICCGDIVKIDGDKLYIGEIKWQVMGFIVVWNDGQTKSHLPEYCEVIGNIYDDSHLSEEAK